MIKSRVLNQTAAVSFLSLFVALACGGTSTSPDADGGRSGADAGNGSTNGSGEAGDTGSGSTGSGSTGSGSTGSGSTGSGSTGSGSTGSGSTGSGSTGSGSTGSGGTGSGSTNSGGSGSVGGGTADPNALGVCSNGIDDDGDGFVDGFDPECTGALDNDERSFATGIPGDNRDPKWQDCFFDGNSGAGDDGCRYSTDCLTGELEPDHASCTLSQECIDFCKPLTPNGCDCFGCCTLEGSDGTTADVLIGASCSLSALDDEEACPRCEKSSSCNNTCGRCELCPGKTAEDLPADCAPTPPTGGAGGQTGSGGRAGGAGASSGGASNGGASNGGASNGGASNGGSGGSPQPPPAHTCDGGERVCSETIACPSSFYCLLGCCMVVVR